MALQLQIHPKPARWSNLGPFNAFPLPAAIMLKFVSRQHRRKGSGEVSVSFSRVTAGFPSSFPSLPGPLPCPRRFCSRILPMRRLPGTAFLITRGIISGKFHQHCTTATATQWAALPPPARSGLRLEGAGVPISALGEVTAPFISYT